MFYRTVSDVIGDVIETQGGLTEKRDGDCFDFVLPPEMAVALKSPETGIFTFSIAEGDKGAIPLTLESDSFRAFEALFEDRGRLCIATYPAYEPNMGKLSKALPASIRFNNATFKDDETRIETIHYALISFNYTAFSDDKIEGIITLLVNALNGSVTRISKEQLVLCGQLSDVREVKDQDNLRQSFRDTIPIAIQAVQPLIKEELCSFIASAQRRLNRDIARICEYYALLSQEIKNKLGSGTVGAEQGQARLKAIDVEQAWKITDMRAKYALNVETKLLNVIVIETKSVVHGLTIKRRMATRRYPLVYNPLLRHYDPMTCSACYKTGDMVFVCDEKLHFVCGECFNPIPENKSGGCPVCR